MYVSDIGLAPYVSYSTSFDPVVGSYNAARAGGAFQPTEGEQYEAGIKYQPPGLNSFITASVFELTQTNVSTRDPLFPSSSVQTGEIRVRGAELEAVASLAQGLNVIGAYTYLDGEITKANDGTVGNRPGLVPQHAASLWADYRMGEGSALPGLGFGAGVRYTSSLYGDNANVYRSPSVTLADASVSYEFGNYRLSVNGSNIFDKRYVASCTGATYCYYGTGRTVIGTLAYRW
jgi:iron complex outermembrane receptor protein